MSAAQEALKVKNSYRIQEDKRMSLKEAIASFVPDGALVAVGGMGGMQCVAHTYEIIRQGKKDLTVYGDSPCEPADMLIGAGCVKKVEVGWLGYAVAGIGMNYRRAVEQAIPRTIEVEEYSNYTIGLRLLAGALAIPFMPTLSLTGSDIPVYNKRVMTTKDPYSGEDVTVVPAVMPDVGIVHVHRADIRGNSQILSFSSNGENIARASKHTIITCEEIISTEDVRQTNQYTIIPEYCVDAVVELPFASHPWNMPYCYAYDIPFHMEEMKAYDTREGFLKWLDEWCFAINGHEDYLAKVGWERLNRLKRIERKFCKASV
jgi:glutaconate CoA-transferase subunit A